MASIVQILTLFVVLFLLFPMIFVVLVFVSGGGGCEK